MHRMEPSAITAHEWSSVTRLAEAIVQCSGVGDMAGAEAETRKLLAYLEKLEAAYGRHPDILATRADYVGDLSERVRLLLEAYHLSQEHGLAANLTLISASLAQTYIEDLADSESGARWLSELSDNLANHWDDFEHGEYLRLDAILEK